MQQAKGYFRKSPFKVAIAQGFAILQHMPVENFQELAEFYGDFHVFLLCEKAI
jgi:hypothetical protein